MTSYYNEFKPEAAHMLRQLIKDGQSFKRETYDAQV